MEGMSADSLESAIKGRYEQIGAMYKSQDFVEGPRPLQRSGRRIGRVPEAPR